MRAAARSLSETMLPSVNSELQTDLGLVKEEPQILLFFQYHFHKTDFSLRKCSLQGPQVYEHVVV